MGSSVISAAIALRAGDVLIIVDVQRDFLPGGALPVTMGQTVIPVLNRYIQEFDACGLKVIASRDWHPPEHCSFTRNGGVWPVHCVAGTHGAGFAPDLALPPMAEIVCKGTLAAAEAYSAFTGTDLVQRLRDCGCRRVFIGGLATDYCVRATALDALSEGFKVVILKDAVRSVDGVPGEGERALAQLVAGGAQLISGVPGHQ